MSAAHPVAEYFARFVNAAGGAASIEEDRIEAILPPALAAALGREETLSSPLESAALAGLHYGSDLVEKSAAALATGGRFAEVALAPSSRKVEFRGVVERSFEFVNAVAVHRHDEPGSAAHLFVPFAFSANADERREGLLEIGVDVETGLESPHRLEGLLRGEQGGNVPPAPGALAMRSAFEVAQVRAARRATEEISGFRVAVERRLRRDAKRLEEYYGRLVQAARAAARRCRTAANREARLAKIPAILAERDRKVADLAARYTIDLRLRPLVAVRVHVPGRRIRCELRRRQETRDLTLFFDLVAGALRPVPCHGCDRGATSLWFCGAFHGLCPRCRRTCPACSKNLCPKCDAGHEARHADA